MAEPDWWLDRVLQFSSPPKHPVAAAGVELPGGLGAKDKVNEGKYSTGAAASATANERARAGTAAIDGVTAATTYSAAAVAPGSCKSWLGREGFVFGEMGEGTAGRKGRVRDNRLDRRLIRG